MITRDTIIIVDDMEINRVILRSIFEKDYNLLEAENGAQAILLIEQYHQSIAVLLLDLVMPVKDGYQVMAEIGARGFLSEFSIIVITAEDSAENEVKAFDLGASDIIMKPFEPHVVKRRVMNIVELNRHRLNQQELIEEQAAKLRESNEVMLDALSSIIEYRSVETGQHIRRIRMFTRYLLEDVAKCYPEFGLDDRKIDVIASASTMHDIGKIAIPDSILNKPGRLTNEEFEVMKAHTVKGCEMLAGLDRMSDREYLQFAYNICRYHHERWDGKGYPDGLKGDGIPICAQVVGIADCYDALTTDRVYKKAIPPEQAFNMILNGECGTFSPRLLECFKNVRLIFADLSRKYADGGSVKTETAALKRVELFDQDDALDTLQMGQTKYFALLRYADSTVMEVDLNRGFYHVVYLSSQDFRLLKSGSCFEESLRNFAEGAVHPDDRGMVLELLNGYTEQFFKDGLMKRSRRYRIYSQEQKEYVWCLATLVRIDTDRPHQRKAMFIWREEDGQGCGIGWQKEGDEKKGFEGLLGEVQEYLNDQDRTILKISGEFLCLTGYDRDEIQTRFHNRYTELIYEADRAEVLRQSKEQLTEGRSIELEYRITGKNDRLLWVLEKGRLSVGDDGKERFLSILIDVTQAKKAQEELRLTLERHKIILEQANDIILEWDIKKDQILYSSNWKKRFGYEPIADHVSVRLPEASHIHPEDMQGFMELMKEMKRGASYKEFELRIADESGHYRWCKIRAAAQFDSAGRACKAVGIMNDIDEEKKAAQALLERAEQDELTGVYNKTAGRRKVEEYLRDKEPDKKAAMMIIDIDDFKWINDNYGHMFGDTVLQEIASRLSGLFRSGDIISRTGGDEFLIFMKDLPEIGIVEERAQKILEAFGTILDADKSECITSCSIGITFSPRDGRDFEILFQRSDAALYSAKSQGKNRYMIFDKFLMERPFGRMKAQVTASTRIESDGLAQCRISQTVEQAFRIIMEEDDLEQAVNSILRMIGVQFGVSRAYVFEDSLDGTRCQNTYEWCAEGIDSKIDNLRDIDYSLLGGAEEYRKNFNETGVFYCQDAAEITSALKQVLPKYKIQSFLQCEIMDEGGFKGFIGVEDCAAKRRWTGDQIDTLSLVSRLLSAFLLKRRAEERAFRAAEDLRTVLEQQNAWVYIVDPQTWKICYANSRIHERIPGAHEGAACYEALFRRSSPCEDCPILNRQNGGRGTAEMYNPVPDVWVSAAVSSIRWNHKDSWLVTCQDITQYK